MSDDLRRQRHDLHELLLAQLAAHRAEDAGGARLAFVVDQHRRGLVEADVGAVLALGLLRRPHDHRFHHLALLHLAGGDRVLDRDDHDVTEPGVAAFGATEHADHERAPRAGVVGDLELRFLLDHGSLRLLRAFDDCDHAPALALGQRPRFHDAHRVTRLGAVLVVRRDRLGPGDLLAVKAMGEATDHRDRHRLLHFVADDGPGPNFPAAALDHADALSCKIDRKSTRLNSSHSQISYAVFCLKKKKYTINHFYDA